MTITSSSATPSCSGGHGYARLASGALVTVGGVVCDVAAPDRSLRLDAILGDHAVDDALPVFSADARFVAHVEDTEVGHTLRVHETTRGRQVASHRDVGSLEAAFPTVSDVVVVRGEYDVGLLDLRRRGPFRRLGEDARGLVVTGPFVRLHDGASVEMPFVHVVTGARRVVTGDVRAIGGGRVISARADAFDLIDLETGATTTHRGRFVAANDAVLVRCVDDVLVTDQTRESLGACPGPEARITLREDGRVLVERGLEETMFVRLDDGARVWVRVVVTDDETVTYAHDQRGAAFVLGGDAAYLVRREAGPAMTARLGPVPQSEAVRLLLARVLAATPTF